MAAPSALSTVGKNATAANGTSLVITLSADLDAGDLAVLAISVGSAPTVTDSSGNVWQSFTAGGGIGYLFFTVIAKKIAAGGTITMSFTSGTCAAIACKATAASWTSAVSTLLNFSNTSSTSSTIGLSSQTITGDSLSVGMAAIPSGSPGDFLSVNNGYTLHDTQYCSGTGNQRSVAFIYKQLTVSLPNVTTGNPSISLAGVRTYAAGMILFPGLTDRGSAYSVRSGPASTRTGIVPSAAPSFEAVSRGAIGKVASDGGLGHLHVRRSPSSPQPDYAISSE